jgi:hypothetical protein
MYFTLWQASQFTESARSRQKQALEIEYPNTLIGIEMLVYMRETHVDFTIHDTPITTGFFSTFVELTTLIAGYLIVFVQPDGEVAS